MNQVAKAIRAAHPEDELYLLLAKRNSGNFTYDGIELGGERVCVEIEEEIESIRRKGGNITKLSIVGYSLGGLVARYAIGLLYAKGVLDKVEPVVRNGYLSIRLIDATNIRVRRTLLPSRLPISVYGRLFEVGTTMSGIGWEQGCYPSRGASSSSSTNSVTPAAHSSLSSPIPARYLLLAWRSLSAEHYIPTLSMTGPSLIIPP